MRGEEGMKGVGAVMLCSLLFAFGVGGEEVTPRTTPTEASNMETCQCGVFLLGTQPLVFSAEAKPILSGMPVPANCSARDDKLQCASICRQLIETMSQSNEDSPIVQTVVLAATRTLACQRFNESEKVPLPRTIDASAGGHHAKLDGMTNTWKFLSGPLPRADLTNEQQQEEEEEFAGRLTQPKFLGGFYRWCDQHWIYAGVSLHEPLCCLQHLPKKCPPSKSSRNGRRPRLIIRRCKNDDCSSEEDGDFQALELLTEKTTEKTTTTETPEPDQENEEDVDGLQQDENEKEEANATSSETINPFDPSNTPKPPKKKPLNSTAITEAFKFFTSLMDSIGYGEVVQGITSVLPASTAAELIDRVDVGGWVGQYQDQYMAWPREFSLGYCYVEYSLFNAANEGFSNTANNLINRLFKNQRSSGPPSSADGLPLNPALNPYPPGPVPNNFISAMPPPIPDSPFFGHNGLAVNRRVKRGVTVSRSYSETGGPSSLRRVVRKKFGGGTGRNVQSQGPAFHAPTTTTTTTSTEVITQSPEVIFGNGSVSVPLGGSQQSFQPSSFIPTSPAAEEEVQPQGHYIPSHFQAPSSSELQHVPLVNPHPHYYQNQYYHYEVSKHQNQQPQQPPPYHQQQEANNYQQYYQQAQPQPMMPEHRTYPGQGLSPHPYQQNSMVEFARPRRNNPQPPPPPRSRQSTPAQKKEGPSPASLMNLANIFMQTALSSNQGGGGGDQVTNIVQNAIPLVSQVANSPAIQSMVSSMVTSFLTPPQKGSPPPPSQKPPKTTTSIPPSQALEDEEENYDDSTEDNFNLSNSGNNKLKDGLNKEKEKEPLQESGEEDFEENTLSSGNKRPENKPKPSQGAPGSGSDGGMLPNLLSQMVSTYVKYLLGGPSGGGGGSGGAGSKPSGIHNRNPIGGPQKPEKQEPKDIVEMICNVAKPFFMSYFGVVPDDPGFGKLRINRNGHRHRSDKDALHGIKSNDILTHDPDPGTGITDVLFGSANIPETGNSLIDFGNRVVFAFHSANDAQHGLYCFKQYSVNKLWDYFRVGVRAVFKK